MKYWLAKTEPDVYSWDTFKKDKKTFWDGVRNYEARNNMQAMEKGDHVIFYHTGKEKQAVGIAEVVKTAYQDPSTDDDRWVAVDLKPAKALPEPVTLAAVKANKTLAECGLVKKGRISVIPLTKKEFDTIKKMGGL